MKFLILNQARQIEWKRVIVKLQTWTWIQWTIEFANKCLDYSYGAYKLWSYVIRLRKKIR